MEEINIPRYAFIIKNKKITKFFPNSKLITFEKNTWLKKFTLCKDFDKLQITDVGLYSIATPEISDSMIVFVEEIIKRYDFGDLMCLNILETHGGIGGFSTRFAEKCKSLKILEIDKLHVNILKNNLDIYQRKNYSIINTDALNIIFDKSDDILENIDMIVCDPPWGDEYYKHKSLKLGINNVNIWYIVNILIKRIKLFVLMAPKNFDINDFVKNVKVDKICIKKLHKHFLIAVINN